MKCVIPGANVKVFGRAIHSLSKIGEELYFEPVDSGLALRTVNSSRSAYACYVFSMSFFLQYEETPPQADSEDSDTETVKCKIGMKSCVGVFKSLSTLEKTVEKCKIELDMQESRLVFQLYCRHGIVKTYNLAFIECETLQAVFSKDLSPNVLVSQTRLLCDVVTNFQTSQEEVSLIVDPERARFKNYTEDEPDATKVIHTELSLDPDEFDNYQVGIDGEVTFCLKELRAILAFAEPGNLPIAINFETAGMPIIFSIKTDLGFEATFVLATLADKSSSNHSQSSQAPSTSRQTSHSQQPHIQNQTIPHRTSSTPSHTAHRQQATKNKTRDYRETHNNTSSATDLSTPKAQIHRNNSKCIAGTSQSHPGNTHTSNSNHSGQPKNKALISDKAHTKGGQSDISQHRGSAASEGNGDSRDPTSERFTNAPPVSKSTSGSGDFQSRNVAGDMSPVIPLQSQKTRPTPSLPTKRPLPLAVDSDSDTEEENETLVPGTPPGKRFRSMFSGLSQATTAVPSQNRSVAVLAEDTDEED